jgi:hypothetical protein
MAFRMTCPKCASFNLDLEEDQRAYLGGGRHQVQLHCYTCGYVIYGEKRIQSECDTQYSEWEARQKTRTGPPAPAPAAAKPAAAPSPAAAAPAPSAASPSPAPAAAAPAAAAAGATNGAPATPAVVVSGLEFPGFDYKEGQEDPETGLVWVFPAEPLPADKKGRMREPCCWPPCNKYARPNSKYCSRNCSNKNARARYAKRKK